MQIDLVQNTEFKIKLKEKVFDQDEAIDIISDTLTYSTLLLKESKSPVATFFFCGEISSGKKFLASQIAQYLKIDFKVFSMSEYASAGDSDKLFSSSKNDGELFNYVESSPAAVIVFEDIDRAHESVQIHLTQLFTNSSSLAKFTNVIVVFTSILGKEFYQNERYKNIVIENATFAAPFLFNYLSKEKKSYEDQLVNVFSTDMISLFSNQFTLVIFKSTTFSTFSKIAIHCLNSDLLYNKKNINLNILPFDQEKISTFLMLSIMPHLSARKIVHQISSMLFKTIIQNISKLKTNFTAISLVSSEKIDNLFLKIKQDEEKFYTTMIRQQRQARLEWSCHLVDEIVELCLIDSSFIDLDFSLVTKISDPEVKYSQRNFESIAGQYNAKKSLLEIVKLFKEPENLIKFSIPKPRGIVLYGPQGTGKSVLAEAFSYELGYPFIKISGADLFDPELIQLAYTKARETSPCIIILDEIDSKGVSAGVVSAVPASYISSYLNLGDIFTIATARTLEDVPVELTAPNLLDIMIEVGELDNDARKFFIKKIFDKPHDKNIDIDKVIAYMTGMNGYDLQRIGTQAALSAIIHGADEITEVMLVEQINKIKYGEKIEPQRIKNPEEEKYMTAYHEAGHAVLSIMLLPQVKIEQVTVAPRSEALGFVSYHDENFVTTATRDEIFKNLCVLLAGRVVKVKKFGEKGIDSGDVADIGQATLEAYAAIAHLGMDDELGYINILSLTETQASGFLKEKIENRVLIWLSNSKKETEILVDKYWNTISLVAEKLIDNEMLSGEDLAKIVLEFQPANTQI